MTDLLIRIMNLPIAAQRLIMISILSLGVSLVVFVTSSIISTLTYQADNIIDGRHSLARLERMIAQSNQVIATPQLKISSSDFLTGENEAIIQAALQNRINTIATSLGTTVLSAGGVPAIERDGVKYVGIRANLQGSLSAFHNTLVQLETTKPYLVVRELNIRSMNTSINGTLDGPVVIGAQISFFGALYPGTKLQTPGGKP